MIASRAGTGWFLSLEGIDGCGKSTQARHLAETLRAGGAEVVLTREPGGSPGAEEIRRLVVEGDPDRWSAETEILLFIAARRDHWERTIAPALAAGATVITDRFTDSTRVYQGTTRGDLTDLVDRLHALMIPRRPDLTLVIDVDPAAALATQFRGGALTAEQLLAAYCRQLHGQLGTYEAVAARVQLDRRTVRKYIVAP